MVIQQAKSGSASNKTQGRDGCESVDPFDASATRAFALLDFTHAGTDIKGVVICYSFLGVIWIRPDVKKRWLRVVVDQLAT